MKKILVITLALVCIGNTACKKSVLEVKDPGNYSFDNYFRSAEEVDEAVIATYAVFLHPGMYAREYYFIFDLLGNDASNAELGDADGDLEALADYNFSPDNQSIGWLWASLYRMILRANVVIDRATKVWKPKNSGEIQLQKEYIAEAKFLRAYANFQLVTLWGDVPLRKSYDSTRNNHYPVRTPAQEVWAFVESDLKAAVQDLPDQYSNRDFGRATKDAATALLGKAYLYQGKNALAKTTLQTLVGYTLAPDDPEYDDIFNSHTQNNVKEIIFQVMHGEWEEGDAAYMFGDQESVATATHGARAWEYGFNDNARVYVSDPLVDAFTYSFDGHVDYVDPRAEKIMYGDPAKGGKDNYCNNCDGGGHTLTYDYGDLGSRWRKYEYYEDVEQYEEPQSSINSVVIRYADVLLMLAELDIKGGNAHDGIDKINLVRERAHVLPYDNSATNQAQAMKLLMRERQIELAGEQSRYFDLVRWGILKSTLTAEGLPVQDKHVLLPIPRQERDTNPNLTIGRFPNWN